MKPVCSKYSPPADRRAAGGRLALFGLGLLLSGCHVYSAATPPPVEADPPAAAAVVPVTRAALHPWPRKVRVQGSLGADEEAVIGAKIAGRVKAVKVDRGTPVRPGQVLAELEPEEFDLRVRQAEAQLAQARAKLGLRPGEPEEKLDPLKAPPVAQEQALLEEARYQVERARVLIGQRAVAVEELQKLEVAHRVAKARYDSALNSVDEQLATLALRRAELALAQQHQADAVITAPFQGVVQARHLAPGVYLAVGAPVATLVRTDPLRFRAGVPEREAALVRVNGDILITVDGQPEPVRARVTRVSPALDRGSRALIIEADVANAAGRLRAGLFAQAEIVVAPQAQALAVPESALVEFAGVEKVWRVHDQQAREHRVVTGRRERGLVEILQGLGEGDAVVTDARQGRAGPVVLALQEPNVARAPEGNEQHAGRGD